MKARKMMGLGLWILGIGLYLYPDIATSWQKIQIRHYVKVYEKQVSKAQVPKAQVPKEQMSSYGYIQIPKMQVTLPLYVGEEEEHLKKGAAILRESDLPGGKNKNCVIAAHRGYRGKPYFRDIEMLESGDEILLRTPERKLRYKVLQAKIIKPEDTKYLKRQKGRDLITLLSCHPYRGNGKYRYLVYAVRKKENKGEDQMEEHRTVPKTQDVKKERYFRKICGIFLFALLLFGIFGMPVKAAGHSLSKKIDTSSHIVTYQWKKGAKFMTGKGLDYQRENACVLLHYLDGELGQCVYAEQDTPVGEAKKFDVTKDARTSWMYDRKNGYEKYKYIGIAQEYFLSGKVTLKGITGSEKLMKLPKNKRQMLAQGFSWYMQHASYNRTEGKTVKLISQIPDFGAAKQVVLYDQIYTAAQDILEDYTITESTYKLERGGNSHQPIAVFKIVTNPKPVLKAVTRKEQGHTSQKVSLEINKKDSVTEAGLSGAVFELVCDGKRITSVTTNEKGIGSYIYERILETKEYRSTKKYVGNWEDLDKKKRTQMTESGYYQNKTLAEKAAQKEVNRKVEAELQALRTNLHMWKIIETKAPFGHKTAKDQEVLLTEKEEKKLKAQIWNYPEYRELQLEKKSETKEYGVEAGLFDAVYVLYAEEEILDSDNKTTVYVPGEEVARLKTDKTGQAKLTGLHPGKYYLKEKEAPPGFLLDTNIYPVDLTTTDQSVVLTDAVIRGRIAIQKTYGNQNGTEVRPEKDAEFVLYDSQDNPVETLRTDENGRAQSGWLPYGNYRVEQTKGLKDYSFLPSRTIAVTEDQKTYEMQGNDIPEYAGITISKVMKTTDRETGIRLKEAEQGAEFEIRTEDGSLIERLVTDVNGTASSKELSPGNYIVHQKKGTSNFSLVSDYKVQIKAGEKRLLSYALEDKNIARKVRIRKKMEKNGKVHPEADAEFAVLNQKKEKILTLVTDEKGEAAALLTQLEPEEPFYVKQTKGAEGYSMMELYDSTKETPTEEDGHLFYIIEATDAYEDYAMMHIKKTMVTKRHKTKSENEDPLEEAIQTKPEDGAVFEIMDDQGKVVETLETDENGEAISGKLDLGTYVLHQVKGAKTHAFCEDKKVILGAREKGTTVSISIQNEEKPVSVILTKHSAETGLLLNDATYEVLDETGKKVAQFTTGVKEDGIGECMLPYGTYTLKEILPTDGFKCSAEKEIEIQWKSAPDGTINLEDQELPVFGKIMLTKTGDQLQGYSMGQFQYVTGGVRGATYSLFAKEDILLDNGEVLWKAGTLISSQKTDEQGKLQFQRKKSDGTMTEYFPMGLYEVRETEAPFGFRKDEKSYEIRLNWDEKAKKENTITLPDVSDSPEESSPVIYPEANEGPYILLSGSEFRRILRTVEDKMHTLVFTTEEAPADVACRDVSSGQDGSVVMWMEDQTCMVSTQTADQDVILNADSSELLRQMPVLEQIYFDAIETSDVINANNMFNRCVHLTELDLTNFCTDQMRYVKNMFRNCTSLKTIYANTTITEDVEKIPIPIGVRVTPKYEFLVGSVYEAEDFQFYLQYSDGSEKEILPAADTVRIYPEKAEQEGEAKVTFSFSDAETFAGYKEAKTTVKIIAEEEADTQENRDVTYELETEDTFLTKTIEIEKEAENGKPVEGAVFGLYACGTIKNAKGVALFQKGDLIQSTSSECAGEGEKARAVFSGLPSGLYGDGTDPLYEIREIKSAAGYQKVDTGKHLTFSGKPKEDADVETVVNKKQTKVVLEKCWDDGNDTMGVRPEKIIIHAEKDGEKKDFELTKAQDWRRETDIPVSEMQQWKFEEEIPTGYEQVHAEKDEEKGVYTVTNKIKDLRLSFQVEKNWEDESDQDGIRPDKVKVYLYRNGMPYKETWLGEENDWKDDKTFTDIPAEDDKGQEYVYECKEEQTELVNGNKRTGYLASYEEEDIVRDGKRFQKTVITNEHVPETNTITIHKKIIKEDINWEQKIPTFTFQLEGKTISGETVKREQMLTFSREETEHLLEEAKDGSIEKSIVFENLKPGTYKVKEEQTDPYYVLQKIRCKDTGVVIDEENQEISWLLGRKDGSLAGRTKDGIAVFENEIRMGRIKVKKTDEQGNPLAGVCFVLYDDKGQEVATKLSDADGVLSFDNLRTGNYTMEEARTAPGKNKLTKAVKITLPLVMTEKETQEKKVDTTKGVSYASRYYFYELSYHVSNSAVLALPKTGSVMNRGLLIAGVISLGMGVLLTSKKRRCRYGR